MGWTVLQHNRLASSGRFHPFTKALDAQTYIVLRDPVIALKWAEAHPRSRVYLWLHDLCGLGSSRATVLTQLLPQLSVHGVSIVTVSDFHKAQLRKVVDAAGFYAFPIHRIYNPVVLPDLPQCNVNPDQLVFFSSPHKGIETALKVFSAIRSKFRSMRLLIANPGYFPSDMYGAAGVDNLGAIPRTDVLTLVKSSLCTLMPNYVYPETFGLVLAESNAVGTPVLAHDYGAAAEVLADARQIVRIPRGRMRLDSLQRKFPWATNTTESAFYLAGGYDEFIDRIAAWRSGIRPRVSLREDFSLANVVSQWRQLILT